MQIFISARSLIEHIKYLPIRKFDKQLITALSTCEYIADAHNVILLGATGAGKTYMSNAFGVAACRHFYSTKYIRLPDLLNEFAIAR